MWSPAELARVQHIVGVNSCKQMQLLLPPLAWSKPVGVGGSPLGEMPAFWDKSIGFTSSQLSWPPLF